MSLSFPYTSAQMPALCANLNCCAGTKGYDLLQKEIKGKDCKCERSNLAYLLRANKIICSYVPAGIVNEGVSAAVIFNFDALTGVTFIRINTIDLTHDIFPSPTTIAEALLEMAAYLNGSTDYTAVVVGNTIQVNTPVGDYNDTLITFDLGQPPIFVTYKALFAGGQYTRTDADNCLTADEASQILQNLDGLCCCGNCTDYLIDAQP